MNSFGRAARTRTVPDTSSFAIRISRRRFCLDPPEGPMN
jgi:hypothetical protein